MRYKVIEEFIKRKKGNELNWCFISEHCSKDFIIKHKDDHDYTFYWAYVAKNKNIDLKFVQENMDYFVRDEICIMLNKKIAVDLDFILKDHHVKLGQNQFIDDISYREIEIIYPKCEEVCENYKPFYKEYDPTNNPHDCASCGDYSELYKCSGIQNSIYSSDVIYDPVYLIDYKKTLYIIDKKYLTKACEILKSGKKLVSEPDNLYSFMDSLSYNKSISLQEKLDTNDIEWNWEKVYYAHQYEFTKETRDQIKFLIGKDSYIFKEIESKTLNFSTGFLDEILDGKKDVSYLENLTKDQVEIIKNYHRKDELIKKILNYEGYKTYFMIKSVSSLCDTEYIKNNLDEKWDFETVFEKKEADFEFLKFVYNSDVSKFIPWKIVSKKRWVTDELIIENLDMPWEIYEKTDDWSSDKNFDVSDSWA